MTTTSRRLLASLLIGGVLVAVGLVVMSLLFELRGSRLRAADAASRRQWASTWATEALRQKRAVQQAEQVRLRRQHEEMVLALGGPVVAAAKNPHLDIAGMLQSVAEQCAGGRPGTHVTVERFTEFTLMVPLEAPIATKAPAEVTQCILSQTGGYLYRLQFIHHGNVVAELDRRAIESIPDWSQAGPEAVRALLTSIADVTETPANNRSQEEGPVRDPDEERNLTRREKLQNEALRSFNNTLTNSVGKVLFAIRQQDSSTSLLDVRALADMNARQESLLANERYLADAFALFSNPTDEYRRALVAAGLDALFIETALRAPALGEAVRAPLMLAVIERAQIRNRSAAGLVQLMTQHLGSWSFDLGTRKIQFDSSALASDYQAMTQKVNQDTEELEAALSRWSRK